MYLLTAPEGKTLQPRKLERMTSDITVLNACVVIQGSDTSH